METKVIESSPERVLVEIPGDRYTPLGLAGKLQARALLESASFHKGRERYSFLLLREAFTLQQDREGLLLQKEGGREGWRRLSPGPGDILDELLRLAAPHAGWRPPFPFPAGGIGYLAYENASRFETVRLRERDDPLGLPEACFLFGHLFLIFDHYTDRISLLGLNYRDHRVDLPRLVEETAARIGDLDFNFLGERRPARPARLLEREGEREEFLAGVRRIREQIVEGNLLQGVLSRRLEVETSLSALEVYRRLRSANPSPYLFYLDFGRFQLFGASPEVHVKVRRGKATMRPIAGTRRRGDGEEEDLRLEKELLTDEKERAEHLMLVDLARNDLGRVCRPATIRVTESMAVERYSHVMHLVSQVEGELEEGRTGLDALRATFPAGTVSGAPKIRAIEVIDGLEPQRRGFYGGVVGYLEPDGGLDTCIAIRCAARVGDRLVLQAGAGVVYDSDPQREYEETQGKLRALAQAAGVATPGVATPGVATPGVEEAP